MIGKVKLPLHAIAASAAGIFLATAAHPASITHDTSQTLRHVLIEGDIEEGDYEKFVNAVLLAGSDVYSVYIASRGGDAAEAMKIGGLIRQLKLRTQVPRHIPVDTDFSPRGPFCDDLPVAKSNCTCASACVLIYLSGVYRYGDYLGVHRAFIDHNYLRTLSMEEGASYSRAVSNALDSYLDNMGAPASLLEKIGRVPSNEIEILNTHYIQEEITGYAKDYQEWIIAKCGGFAKYYNLARFESDPAKLEEYIGKYKSARECEKKVMKEERRRAFYPAIKDAFEHIDNARIPRRSILEYLVDKHPFDLSHLIGVKNQEAMDLLALIGIPTLGGTAVIQKMKDADYGITSSITIGFDTDGTVYHVVIYFFEFTSEILKLTPYHRHFLNGLNRDSSQRDFVQVLGQPEYASKCWKGEMWCRAIWQTEHADIEVVFDGDEEPLRAINFNTSGWWEEVFDRQ